MADAFSDREKSFENKFKHDEELRFRVMNRRNKLLGLWLAEKFGITGPEADAYAKEVVEADFEKPGDDDVVEKVMADVSAHKAGITEAEIRVALEEFAVEAKKQLMDG